MTAPRIASLFTGIGPLDLAVMDVYGGEVVWHCQFEPPDKHGRPDRWQYAAHVLAHRFPGVPNLGDLTAVDWHQVRAEYGRPDILTGGFPCTDVSASGPRAGLAPGTRSGLWSHMAHAISILRPRLVVIENVEGLLSTPARREMGPGPAVVDEGPAAGGVLRAAGAVLGDLASLGFDAEWDMRAASDDGAPHRRRRVIFLAWPADAPCPGLEGQGAPGRAAERGDAAEDADGTTGDQRRLPAPGQAEGRGARAHAGGRGRAPAADTHEIRRDEHGELSSGRDAVQQWVRDDVDGRHSAPADAESVGRGEGRPGAARIVRGPDVAERGRAPAADTHGRRQRPVIVHVHAWQPDVAWGVYEPAVRRWEAALGRPAPRPVDVRGRLSPVFVEWMMGLPAGWVTAVPGPPGMTDAGLRNARLKALGNSVVWQQIAAGIRILHARAFEAVTAP
ncbi:DNA cytosine methyltransferase [Streptomyces phytophilus]|uniref:DNA cytosine methyltransferase n=1 Tax=Streptomyces phytophilus TaxID=722715 RepID=UPI001C68AA5D|nr:DNA cytosine methyltransferase [Streptomyces phytophilus]